MLIGANSHGEQQFVPKTLTSDTGGRDGQVQGHIKTLQKYAAVHASIHNRFNQDRQLNRREIFKQNRSAALAEWRQLAA